MKKYTITKSMNRHERCNLAYNLYNEMIINGNFEMIFASLEHELAQKKKKRLYGNKFITKFHVVRAVRHRGIVVYNIITKNKGIDVIFDTSPVDAPYVEYIRISPSGTAVIYSQHLLDRYNERVCKDRFTNHKDIMTEFFIQNPNKANIPIGENNQIVQRIDEGFVLGRLDKENNYLVLNTFYESEEYRDSDIKDLARKSKQFQDNLSVEQISEYDILIFLHQRGALSTADFENKAKDLGLI